MSDVTNMGEFKAKRASAQLTTLNGRLVFEGILGVSPHAARRASVKLNDFITGALTTGVLAAVLSASAKSATKLTTRTP